MSLIVRQVLDIFPAILLGFIGDKYTMNVSFEEIIGYEINDLHCSEASSRISLCLEAYTDVPASPTLLFLYKLWLSI